MLADVDERIGLDRLRALHVNDAKQPLGSNRDNHANVGKGLMGAGLSAFLGHPACRVSRPSWKRRAPTATVPMRAEVQKLRDLHKRWTKKKRR